MNLLKLNRNTNQWKTEFNFQKESPTMDSLFLFAKSATRIIEKKGEWNKWLLN